VIAVCVGHSRRGDDGAVGWDGTTEWQFNSDLAERVAVLLENSGHEVETINHYAASYYPQAMTWLANELAHMKPVLAVELHFNSAATRAASGHEWLYWHGSEAGRHVAGCLEAAMKLRFPDRLRRGVKMITEKDNGSGFVRKMPCPAVVAEPFFGSNEDDWTVVACQPDKLASALANGLHAAAELLTKGFKR
jgi:N-acetylmuramoyl-L-alanine amidase